MNQIADILKLASEAHEQNIDAVLATVVRTEGSAYRRTGAMMLICADGRSVGMISGGCLEPHIIKRAFWLTRNGANVQVYQTGDEQTDTEGDIEDDENDDLDIELNFGLGCNGRVHVLFERLATANPWLDVIRQVRRTQQPVMMATLIRSDDYENKDIQHRIGMRIDLDAYINRGQMTAVDANSGLNQTVPYASDTLFAMAKVLSEHKLNKKDAEYVVIKSKVEQGSAQGIKDRTVQTEWLVQRLQPQVRLLICGAGNDVMPLVTMAKLQDWHVTVIDSRSQYATRTRFPQADTVMCLSLDDSETLIELSQNAAVALMSHSLSQDRARLAVLLEHSSQYKYKYFGQLGPRYRTERLIKEISAATANPAVLAAGITKLHYPIGYKLGGDGPEALALSIMAQISAVIHDQTSPAVLLDSKPNVQVSIQQTPIQPVTEHACVNDYVNGYAHD
ncbi:XdhC family protein [Psychrobacter sp. 72-O-c]|uniref:XdhC family protein n=1 Tax=Psychrobacter sp. 72-O-c TaxID=2774125 RepID=UPI00191ADDE8|nr:XdhC/CoxI family protein [Psychrobacter sp. 72-O-c]